MNTRQMNTIRIGLQFIVLVVIIPSFLVFVGCDEPELTDDQKKAQAKAADDYRRRNPHGMLIQGMLMSVVVGIATFVLVNSPLADGFSFKRHDGLLNAANPWVNKKCEFRERVLKNVSLTLGRVSGKLVLVKPVTDQLPEVWTRRLNDEEVVKVM